MKANDYQHLAVRTLIGKPPQLNDAKMMIIWNAMGLAGETGEIVDYLKKGIFHEHGVDPEKVADELGDVLWYIAALAEQYGLDLGLIMEQNIAKLVRRYPQGYSSTDSKERRDVTP